jgi:hypothetical protein
MKKTLLSWLLFAPLISHSAWTEIGWNEHEKVRISIDLDATLFGKKTKIVKILYDFEKPNHQFKKTHLSEIELIEIDCKKKIFRLPQITWYSKNKGRGSSVWTTQNSDWQITEPNSGYEEILSRVCYQ